MWGFTRISMKFCSLDARDIYGKMFYTQPIHCFIRKISLQFLQSMIYVYCCLSIIWWTERGKNTSYTRYRSLIFFFFNIYLWHLELSYAWPCPWNLHPTPVCTQHQFASNTDDYCFLNASDVALKGSHPPSLFVEYTPRHHSLVSAIEVSTTTIKCIYLN